MDVKVLLSRLEKPKKSRAPRGCIEEWISRCPAHNDRKPSLSIGLTKEGKILLKCFAGCTPESILEAIGFKMADIQTEVWEKATITVADLAEDKQIPEKMLREWGCVQLDGYVRITYKDVAGKFCARQRKRWGLSGNSCSAWEPGEGSPEPYGLWKLGQPEYLVLVEGESDTWTLWLHGFPVLGIPGANMVEKLCKAHIPDSVKEIIVVREPDSGGATFATNMPLHLKNIGFVGKVLILDMQRYGHKDPNAWHQADKDFKVKFAAAIEGLRKDGEKTIIRIVGGRLHEMVDMAEEAILKKDYGIYQRDGSLVQLVIISLPDQGKNAIVRSVKVPLLTKIFTESIIWLEKKDDQWISVDCPRIVAEVYLEQGVWKVPVLVGYDVKLKQGGYLGYNQDTGMFLY